MNRALHLLLLLGCSACARSNAGPWTQEPRSPLTAEAGRPAASGGGPAASDAGASRVTAAQTAAGSSSASLPDSGTRGESGSAAAAGGGAGAAGRAAAGGGAGTAGRAAASGSAGATGTEQSCPLPAQFRWKSSAPLAEPKAGWVSLKDFTNVVFDNKHIVYMTTHDSGSSWGSAMFTFDDWGQAGAAAQVALATSTVAPTLLYFAPKDIWVLAYQWGGPAFSYATSTNPSEAESWDFGKTLYSGKLASSSTGPIDQSLICDSTTCYLFFAGDNGSIYRSSLPIAEFPGRFGEAKAILSESQNALFEAVEVYSVKGAQQYLMIVEAIGGQGRFFRAYTSSTLAGSFVAMPQASSEATPFAGKMNVSFDGEAWTRDISHGDLVRTSDQTKTIDPCNLQLLYQGRSPASGGDYGRLPYRPGLLTLVR